MEAQKRPLANVVNVVRGGGGKIVVGGQPLKNIVAATKNDQKYLKRGRDSPPNMIQKKKKNFAANNDENAFDPTRTIETKIKNIKISQKNDLPLKPVNRKQETTTTTQPPPPIVAIKNRNIIQQKQPLKSTKNEQKNNNNDGDNNNKNQSKQKHHIDWQDYYQPPKNLPEDIIDYDRTQIENINSEPIYAFEIFEYLREKEQSTRCRKYMQQQKDISPKMRTILIDWLVEVQQTFELNHETLYHSIKIMDHFLMNSQIKRSRLQLLGIVSMFIAAKCDVCIMYLLIVFKNLIKFFSFIHTGKNLSNN